MVALCSFCYNTSHKLNCIHIQTGFFVEPTFMELHTWSVIAKASGIEGSGFYLCGGYALAYKSRITADKIDPFGISEPLV